MILLELTPEEAERLRALIDGCLADLRDEIRHTDKKAFRARLRSDEEFLASLLHRLEVTGVKTMELA